MLANLQKVLDENPDKFFRIGTGQLADSLSLDHITGFSEILVPFFARQKNAVLELKTKSTNIDRLSPLSPEGNTIVSWSLNSKKIQQEEEHKCAPISERIKTAKEVLTNQGYRAGFHFDPIIDYPGWEKDYAEVLEELFGTIPEKQIAWISLGCLRMMPALKPIMEERFPKSGLPQAEWITGMDGKMRYFKPRRIEIYREMVSMIRAQAPKVTLYLSMESPEVWTQVFGFEPTRESICRLLDTAILQKVPSL
jgi:spore photoproduct lyase